jgi:hypothetical protein
MKKLKFVLLTANIISLLTFNAAMAGFKDNSPDTNKPGLEHLRFLISENGSYDGKPINLDTSGKHGLELKSEDEPEPMTWNDAGLAVKKHGPGWRLPTIGELRMMYIQRKLIGGFSGEDYWSSTEQDINSAWIQGFRLGDQDRYNKQSKLKVRAVRSF